MRRPALVDATLLAVGTFTRMPVPAPSRVDRSVARWAMLLGPFVGLALAIVVGAVVLAMRAWIGGGVTQFLTSAVAIATIAWLTGGIHLDGFADVSDGLASRRRGQAAIDIMKQPAIGALGAASLALMLMLQVAALSLATWQGTGTETVVLMLVTGRVAIVLACSRGIPAARPDGLGAMVAGSVPIVAALLWIAALFWSASWLGARDVDGGPTQALLAVGLGLTAAGLLLARCLRRFGGVTGDVLGAVCEVAATVVALVMAGSPDLASPDWDWLPDKPDWAPDWLR